MEHEEVLAELLKEVLKSLPEGCLFYMDRGLDDLYNEGRLQDIIKYIVQIREWGNEGHMYLFDFAIDLSNKCIEYLISELTQDPFIMNQFINYGIVKKDDWYMLVVDNTAIHMLDTIPISPELELELANDRDIYLSLVSKGNI